MSDSVSETAGDGTVQEHIRIRGARVHNLQNLDVDIPRNQMVVVTGPSGSGKSSLAYDTLYAEGQRQYIESLSVYARQFLNQLERPDVDLIEGLQPTISIDQRAGIRNPRSTVATVTEIYDYLRLLYARLGDPTCHQCGEPIRPQSLEQILEELMNLGESTRMMLLAPIVRGRKGQHKEVFETIRKAGFVRARVDGKVFDIETPPELVRQKAHQIDAVVDRIVVRQGVEGRLADSIKLAIKHGDGLVLATYEEKDEEGTSQWHDRLFSTMHSCPNCKISFEELEPRTFSFNSPYGACPLCEGLGCLVEFDPDLVVPDHSLSLSNGAIAPWKDSESVGESYRKTALKPFLSAAGLRWNTPFEKIPPDTLERLLEGDGLEFPGVIGLLENEYQAASTDAGRRKLDPFRDELVCAECNGTRLRPQARSVSVANRAIYEITSLTVRAACKWFESLEFDEEDHPITDPIVSEITARLRFLDNVGLDYLTLNRPADTLSGGELQRVRLAAGLGAGLVGVCYVLDEPSIGLHPRDNQRLIDAMRDLQQRGNTVLIVEHDEAIMREADWLIDLGPGAGRHGGRIVSQGHPDQVGKDENSLTGRYLTGATKIPTPKKRRRMVKARSLTIEGVTTNNLKDVSVQFPLSTFVCVTGVSGSGKSSLLSETLARALVRRLGGLAPKPGPHKSLRGSNRIDRVVEIDQSPIGRTPRSNPATYSGAFDEIRKVFTNTRAAKQRGYKAGRFSFNVKGGRCEECQGQGQKKIEMNFLPDLYVACPVCEGKRFNRQTLEVKYRGQSIADVLDMRVDESVTFFENFPAISRLLDCLRDVGLGYLTLGQPSTTLSGGEAQRVKLASELGRADTGNTLYILDEPTTGLHFDDVSKLLEVLSQLVDLGNTVIVIEHNLDVIKTADWVIDLGPEGGDGGGQIVATGTPEMLADLEDNHTGRYLRAALNGESR